MAFIMAFDVRIAAIVNDDEEITGAEVMFTDFSEVYSLDAMDLHIGAHGYDLPQETLNRLVKEFGMGYVKRIELILKVLKLEKQGS